MSIFVDEHARVVVQGLTGSQGRFHGLRNRAYGTAVVAGVTPGKGGTDVEGIPAHDEARLVNQLARQHPGAVLIGPNCPGVITPGRCNIGITPGEIALGGGPVGVVSRSGTLTYEALNELSRQGIGQTTCVGIGGDPVPGTGFIDCLRRFEADPETAAVILIGEIGGDEEERAAEYMAAEMTKPVVACIAGVTAPAGRRMGHAGAIVSGNRGTARAKIEALRQAGAVVVGNPTELGQRVAEVVGR